MLKVMIKVTIKFIIVTEKIKKKKTIMLITLKIALLSDLSIKKYFSKITKFVTSRKDFSMAWMNLGAESIDVA